MPHEPFKIIYNRDNYPGTDIFGFYYEFNGDKSESIWLTENNLYFIYPMICKHFPQFDMYSLDNAISYDIWEKIIAEIRIYINLIKGDPEDTVLQPYIDFVGVYCADLVIEKTDFAPWTFEQKKKAFVIGRMEVIQFLEEISTWIENSIQNKKYKYLNIEGI